MKKQFFISVFFLLASMAVQTATAQTVTVRGTMFPFVYIGYSPFDNLFPVTAYLYAVPPIGTTDDPITTVLNDTPLHTATAVYYDGNTYVPGTPKYPGELGKNDHPGVPIRWRPTGIQQDTATNYTPVSGPGDVPVTAPSFSQNTVGLFTFENLPLGASYVLRVSRPGFLDRFALVTITSDGLLGHRFLIPGDLNSNLQVNSQDFSIFAPNQGSYWGGPGYDALYDFNADGAVNPIDGTFIILHYINCSSNMYQDTYDFIIPYF